MSRTYNPHDIESRWQTQWEHTRQHQIDLDQAENPFYNLMEFPYPNGEGLHVGHVFSFGGADTYGRFQRRRGHSVFQPIGFDAFGIHSENYALRVGMHPQTLVHQTTARFRQQLQRLGIAFDWSRAVNTTEPDYYRWTQWIFVQLFKAGLAYRAEANVNWCPSCKTVLANEQVINGSCERCDADIQQQQTTQWFFRITAYADRLLDFRKVDFAPTVIKRQQAWIGRSGGVDIAFQTNDSQIIHVFTTKPETIFGVTFIALAPEHPLVDNIIHQTPTSTAIRNYVEQARNTPERKRQQRNMSGVPTELMAINPVNGVQIPVWIADYVLMQYGTGAVIGVPAHDKRDAEFAATYDIPSIMVIQKDALVNSGAFDGVPTTEAHKRIADWLEEHGIGQRTVRYRLRDWLISRQRYWGPPIPIVYCDMCGTVPVPEEQLPVVLPEVAEYQPTGTGMSPLATDEAFVHTTCPECGSPAQRETDVSDNFLDSAWYFLRYASNEYHDRPWDWDRIATWLPISMYIGGPEHATMHHLYARFISMALYDTGLSPVEEPFAHLQLHGTITYGGHRMSKSRGNVVNPDHYIQQYGADTTRMALLFLGPFDADTDFNDRTVKGIARFLARVWDVCQATNNNATQQVSADVQKEWVHITNQIIARATADVAAQQFHTAIASLMEYTNWLRIHHTQMSSDDLFTTQQTLVSLLAPFAPHMSEELWVRLGGTGSIHDQPWPTVHVQASTATWIELPVQINGRVRDRITIAAHASEDEVGMMALHSDVVQEAIRGYEIQKVVVVPGRVVNIVTT